MASNYDFGVVSTETGATGYYRSVDCTIDADAVALKDQIGNTVERVFPDPRKTIEFTLNWNKTKAAPAVGATITATSLLNGTSIKYQVNPGIKSSESSDGHVILTFSATYFVTNNYPSA